VSSRLLASVVAVVLVTGVGALAAFASPPAAAPAAPAGSASPVDVAADRLDVDLTKRSAALAGHVVLRREGLVLRADRLDARFDESPRVTWAKGAGGVSIEVKGTQATADEVEVDLGARSLELRGNVTVTRAGSRMTAERATIDLAEGRFSLFAARGTLALPASSAP
jgi:lipopolysaccharide export system protein LptA